MAVRRHPRPDVMWPSCIFVMIQNVPHLFFAKLSLSAPRQTRRMQAKASVRNDASVFLKNISIRFESAKKKNLKKCNYEIWVLDSGIFFISFSIVNLVLHTTLSSFSLALFLAVPVSGGKRKSERWGGQIGRNKEFPLHIHFLFLFQFLFSAIFLSSRLFQMEPKCKTYFIFFIHL